MATAHTDDHAVHISFDATQYFFAAKVDGTLATVLAELDACGFGGDEAADAVARYAPELTDLDSDKE
ncbi:hypothetical protein [Halioglobus sp. HI00S01]|uniref:hypothetical protein n=1 Tax=Halioglobus sp. HI00S01 TaxID=1822214 RepID=UPI00082487AA|nr:hypothetical protein [Halioglobus sp. HI00S01]